MPLVIKRLFSSLPIAFFVLHLLATPVRPHKEEPQIIHVDGLARTYLMYAPETGNKQKMPLVIVLHGAGSTAAALRQLTGFDSLAEAQKFIVVYPQGIENQWNDGRGRNEQIDDVNFIRQLIKSVSTTYAVDSLKVYAAGISNGGFFAMRLACELSDRLAAVASVSATVEEVIDQNCQTSHPVSVLLIHGTKDPVVSIDGGKVARLPKSIILSHQEVISRWVHRDNCNATPVMTTIPDSAKDGTFILKTAYSGGTKNTEVISYVISEGGHTWPGSAETQSLFLGKTTHNLNGTQVIWDFFKRHAK